MWPPLIGACCLGVVMGWLVRYFLDRFTNFNAKTFGSIFAVLSGAGISTIFGDRFIVLTGYPVGLLIGVLAYPLISAMDAYFKRRPHGRR